MNKPNGMLSNAERQQILHEWNKTHAEYPEVCIHELFEAQVKRTPEATAVVFGSERVSYDELNRRANQLAHHLRKNGVRPEERVGICAERGVEMVVGLLAVLKAGGAYVPLDPKYPEERLQYMVKDSAPVAVLTQRSTDGFAEKSREWNQRDRIGWRREEEGERGGDKSGTHERGAGAGAFGLCDLHLRFHRYAQRRDAGCIAASAICELAMRAHRVLAMRSSRDIFSTAPSALIWQCTECFVPLASGGSIRLVSPTRWICGMEALAERCIRTCHRPD